jgi:hypothetical protein
MSAQDRERILEIDYSTAELKCPQRIKIGKLVKEACMEIS